MSFAWFSNLLELHAGPHTISTAAMCLRAVVVFFVALGLLRVVGTRAFGSSTPFDVVLKIILGAVLSRAVVAASPFFGTLLASAVFVVLHRLLAIAAYYSDFVGSLIKGEPTVLAQGGQLLKKQLSKTDISEKDLHEGLRDAANIDSLAEADVVRLERNGKITVVKKPAPDKLASAAPTLATHPLSAGQPAEQRPAAFS
ncbi:DUF421 domain-containing protein [Hymenobacter crusticola]|uniref:YetF C-terminal domain-containing protein n=1 Tax=Hymenobacter crusticola TaxID=1770526 RepID=A0A243WH31_9BACT|nr:YetF domain-containing protein [Hymenobacter crusticola]OUJ75136.1 hypothetical protein BXP70_03670 [Hymenobacter crusticola]